MVTLYDPYIGSKQYQPQQHQQYVRPSVGMLLSALDAVHLAIGSRTALVQTYPVCCVLLCCGSAVFLFPGVDSLYTYSLKAVYMILGWQHDTLTAVRTININSTGDHS